MKHLIENYIKEILLSEKILSKKPNDEKYKKVFGNKFKFEFFKSLKTPGQQYVYADYFLEYLGSGSSRSAFIFSSKYALKIATNDVGLKQNETEVKFSSDSKINSAFAKVISYDPEYKWVLSQLVREIKDEKEFKNLTGEDWNDFNNKIIECCIHKKNKDKIIKNASNLMKSIIAASENNDLDVRDVGAIVHWGKTPDNRAVMLDYGLTKETFEKSYKRFLSKEQEEKILNSLAKTIEVDFEKKHEEELAKTQQIDISSEKSK